MFNSKGTKFLALVFTLALVMVLSACGNSGGGNSSDKENTSVGGKEIEIPYVASDNSAARSLVMAEVLKKAGYDVTTTPVQASGPLYTSVAHNPDSFHASGIFPNTDKSYYNKFKSNLTKYDQENLVDDVRVGLAVPKYVKDVDSIDDLKDHKEDFNNDIQGTDARNGVMKQTKGELDEDALDGYNLKEASDQDQFKAVQKAYKQQQPILFTAMDSSWFSKELDVKMLKDPEKIYGKEDQHINLVFNKEFKANHPAAYTITTRMSDDWSKKDEDQLAKKIFKDQKNPEKVAKDYVDDNDNKVDEWLEDINH
ncbi:glycine betaine ABC transporter substrate-binding protein [Staphylococcus warneri]|uniref:glycine betaine ABC transporter substrate-binding protein n=1 Tax=Staphylococcus warneri TaxID=1292 RepID=UPI003261B80A